jgi:membrane-bound lytic murein transglycosylase B
MKKIIMTLIAILGFAFFTTAQERPTLIDSNDDVQDKIQQEPPRDNQRAVERNAKRAAEEKVSKEKLEEAKKSKHPKKDVLEQETNQHKEKLTVPK